MQVLSLEGNSIFFSRLEFFMTECKFLFFECLALLLLMDQNMLGLELGRIGQTGARKSRK